jgi:hypothetical protein
MLLKREQKYLVSTDSEVKDLAEYEAKNEVDIYIIVYYLVHPTNQSTERFTFDTRKASLPLWESGICICHSHQQLTKVLKGE